MMIKQLLSIARDNMLLMGLQLLAPNKAIAQWQYEIIPGNQSHEQGRHGDKGEEVIGRGEGGYWNLKYGERIDTAQNYELQRSISF